MNYNFDPRPTFNVVFANIVWDTYLKPAERREPPPRELRVDGLQASRAQLAVKMAMNRLAMHEAEHWGIVTCTVLIEDADGRTYLLRQSRAEPDGVLMELDGGDT